VRAENGRADGFSLKPSGEQPFRHRHAVFERSRGRSCPRSRTHRIRNGISRFRYPEDFGGQRRAVVGDLRHRLAFHRGRRGRLGAIHLDGFRGTFGDVHDTGGGDRDTQRFEQRFPGFGFGDLAILLLIRSLAGEPSTTWCAPSTTYTSPVLGSTVNIDRRERFRERFRALRFRFKLPFTAQLNTSTVPASGLATYTSPVTGLTARPSPFPPSGSGTVSSFHRFAFPPAVRWA